MFYNLTSLCGQDRFLTIKLMLGVIREIYMCLYSTWFVSDKYIGGERKYEG